MYINSTNSTLDLKTGTLSNRLLKACGEDLQKECSQHAPLKPEMVAVTKVNNVKAKFVYHVALPDCKQEFHATRVGFTHLLNTAKFNKISLISEI